MGFASSYLGKHGLFKPFIAREPARGINLIVVIPAFSEPDVIYSLVSLQKAERPSFPVEVIVVVNSSEDAPPGRIEQNRKTAFQVREWSHTNCTEGFSVHVIEPPLFPRKHAGAGLARKTGMDEAVHRFNLSDNRHGIIASFDADSLCDGNYFTELEKCFSDTRRTGCTIYFEHPLCGDDHSPLVYNAITRYELYLRYFVEAKRLTGFPWSFHTVGSCFAVTAGIYARQGGMNRKTAGEDFYFLHKIFPIGNFSELNSTRIIPSPRVSDRVPFGTGATIRRFAAGQQTEILTWPLDSFDDLSLIFSLVPELFNAKEAERVRIMRHLPPHALEYLAANDFSSAVEQMNRNSSGIITFRKRFFNWFNAFRLLKFLNYTRDNIRENLPIANTARDLLLRLGISPASENKELLGQYRELQRNKIWKC
jgi:hypothetical protein